MIVGKQAWVRRVEHGVLRAVSLGFSLASAYAIRLFFAPLDAVDRFESVITWTIAVGFGVLGYFVSRGLVHRMMNGERIRVYAPICLVVELVDIACNYTLAAEVVHRAAWLASVPLGQRAMLTGITYVVLSVIPLVSVLLAVVDMDLERSKQGTSGLALSKGAVPAQGRGQPVLPRAGANGPAVLPRAGAQGPVVLPRVNGDGAQKAAPLSREQQQAKRAGVWQGLQRQRQGEPEPVARPAVGEALPPMSPLPLRRLLDDPEKQLAEVP